MVQRDNGLVGTTKECSYRIIVNDNAQHGALLELMQLCDNLNHDDYILTNFKLLRGSKSEYIAEFRSRYPNRYNK